MKKRAIPLIAALALVLSATLGMVWLHSARGAADHDEHAEEAEAAEEAGHEGHDHEAEGDEHDEGLHLDGLETIRVGRRLVPEYFTLSGEVAANAEKMARVGSPVDGRIVSLNARVGDTVKTGQTLAVVASRDVAEVQGALSGARAQEKAASGRLKALRALVDAGAITEGPLEAARREQAAGDAAVLTAEADVDRAQKAREAAASELSRVKKLASSKAFSAGPVESAKREVASARAELNTARAQVRVRKAAYARAQRLFETGLVAKRDVEREEADLAQAEAEHEEATTHLDIAQTAMQRESSISSQDLYSIKEVRDAQNAVDDADRDLRNAQAELGRARRHLKLTRSALSREERVARGNLNARRELQAVEADLAMARAQVSAAQASLSAFRATGGRSAGSAASITITAPISGVITARDVSTGQAIQSSQDLFTIEGIDPVWVWAAAYEKDLARVPVGADVVVRVRSYPDQIFDGKVTHIARALDTEARTAKVRCQVPNVAGALQPGMFASVDIITQAEKEAILLPRHAVLDEGGKQVVFIACADCPEDEAAGESVCGSFDKMDVETGSRHGDDIEIVSGLKRGDVAVVTGQYQLKTALGTGTLEAGCADGH